MSTVMHSMLGALLDIVVGCALGWSLGHTWQDFRDDMRRGDAKWALVSLLYNGAVLFVILRAMVIL